MSLLAKINYQLPTEPSAQTKFKESTRDGFGRAMFELMATNHQVVALSADLTESLRLTKVAEHYPQRFVQVGVAEQNLLGVAAGLALGGKIPFATSFAAFNPGRSWDQLRASICYSNLNVKVVGGHAGLTVGEDGATHQALEDLSLTRVLPNLTVIVPADGHQAYQATFAAAAHSGPVYLRLGREAVPCVNHSKPFTLGKAIQLHEGFDLTFIALGYMVHLSLAVAEALERQGINVRVLDMATIKPVDKVAILRAAQDTQAIITLEEHQAVGGLYSAVTEVVQQGYGSVLLSPVAMDQVAVEDTFGESGKPAELLQKYGLSKNAIMNKVLKVLKKKYQLKTRTKG